MVSSQRLLREVAENTTPLKVPGLLKLLSASAKYDAVDDPFVEMAHTTSVSKPSSNQLGSVVGSVA